MLTTDQARELALAHEQGDVPRTGDTTIYTPLDSHYVKTSGDPKPKMLNPKHPKALGDRCQKVHPVCATDRQVAGGQEFRAFAGRYGGAVQRIYYYDWGPGGNPPSKHGFDSALLDGTPPSPTTPGHLPRLVYCELTLDSIKTCPGSRTATSAKG